MNTIAMGKRIREQRNKLDLTQENVSDKLGITPSFYSHIENGSRNVSLDTVIKLSDFFGVSIDYIIRGTNHVDTVPQDKYLRKIIHRVTEFSNKEKEFALDFVNALKKYSR